MGFIALSYLIGLGTVSAQMFLYSLAGIGFSVLSVSVPWAVLFCAVGVRLGFASVSPQRKAARPGALEIVLLALIASQAAYVLFYSQLLPIMGWDAWAIWHLKARAFFFDGAVTGGFLTDPTYHFSHPDYPLLVPLAATWVYTAAGAVDEVAARMLHPLLLLALLGSFHVLTSKASSPRHALVFTALLATTPIVILHSGGVFGQFGHLTGGDYVGYADLALSACFLVSGSAMFLYAAGADRSLLLLAILFAALGAWTKNEGLPFALMIFLMAGFHAPRRLMTRPALGAIVVVTAVFVLPWTLFKSGLGLGGDFPLGPSIDALSSNLERVPIIFNAMARGLFGFTDLFGLTWLLYLVSIAANAKGFVTRSCLSVNLLIVGQLGCYALVFVVTPHDVNWHLATALERLVLHLLPLALFATAVNSAAFLTARLSTSRRAG